jgi:hypothetical protein
MCMRRGAKTTIVSQVLHAGLVKTQTLPQNVEGVTQLTTTTVQVEGRFLPFCTMPTGKAVGALYNT